jgi:TolB-like protein/AraC-like DNA-binding protein
MDQLFLDKVNDFIENNLADENFGVEELAKEIGISRSQLHHRLKTSTGQSPSQIIKEFRLKKAFEFLQNNVANVSEVSYQVGFSSPSYFSTCFSDFFGYPPGKVKQPRDQSATKNYFTSRKILLILLAVLVVTISVLFIFLENRITDKSIAVLPFKYLGNDPNEQHLADGVMDAILLHLSKIEDLIVLDRTSVEQYRETNKSANLISQELDVAYLLEGSFQKYEDQVRLIVQLIKPGKKGHIWAEKYDRNWEEIFSVQSDVAQTIANELHAAITPEEKQLIKKVPTISLTAYDFYQKAQDIISRYFYEYDTTDLIKAEELLFKALEYDSAFAKAYIGLANIYGIRYSAIKVLYEDYLDSILILADIALSFDNQLSEAYVIKGHYHNSHKNIEKALIEYDKAISLNPNDFEAYMARGSIYIENDLVKCIDNYHKAASLHRGAYLQSIYRSIVHAYALAGFKEKATYYAKEVLKLDYDSTAYFAQIAHNEFNTRNYEKSIEYYKKVYHKDSNRIWVNYWVGINYIWLGRFDVGFEYFKKLEDIISKRSDIHNPPSLVRIGHAYWVNGFRDEAEGYFNDALELYDTLSELGRRGASQNRNMYYDIAAIYALLGDKDKAYENLRHLNHWQSMQIWIVSNINDDPMFDSIRDEPEFQQIVKDIEAKYQAEHERVRKWLEENDML